MKAKAKTKLTTEPAEQPAHELFRAIASLKSPAEAEKFFKDLCTPAEIQAMADRWLVVGPIKNDVPYRKIHELTRVSVTTVGRVARNLTHGTGGYDLVFERIGKKSYAKSKKT